MKNILYMYRKLLMAMTLLLFLSVVAIFGMNYRSCHNKLQTMRDVKLMQGVGEKNKVGGSDKRSVEALKSLCNHIFSRDNTKDGITAVMYHDSKSDHLKVRDVFYENSDGSMEYGYIVMGNYSDLYHYIYDINQDLPFLKIKEILFQKATADLAVVELKGKYTDERHNKK